MQVRLTIHLIFTFLVFSALGLAETERFASGLLRRFAAENQSRDLQSEAAFIEKHYKDLSPNFEWRAVVRNQDRTHTHSTFELRYQGRKVLDHALKVHTQKNGGVDLASSTFAQSFFLALPSEDSTQKKVFAWKRKLEQEWKKKLGISKGIGVRIEPVVWVNAKNFVPRAALDVHLTIDHPWTIRHFIIDEVTEEILEQKQVARSASATVKVHKVSPSYNASADSVTLSDLDDTSSLKNSYIWVRREEDTSNPTTVEVQPIDFTAVGGFSTNPTSYNYTCTGTSAQCPNQGFDAVNVYYHIANFRSRINSYLASLGATVDFPYDDPLNILINPVSLDFGLPGLSDDVNNAMYVGEPCRSDGTMERCIVFLRPATLSATDALANCGSSSSQFYDLAREGIVVAHEYQHYITDTITGIAFTASSTPKVGDALHEGYSDYMAASYVSDLVSADITLVGEYALQECTALQRQLNAVRPYENSEADEDPHTSGISWASAFWKLRTEFGEEIADLLALKSLFYISTQPGFFDSVEAVVKADEALYAGTHVDRIRTIFYTEAKWTGKLSMGSDGIAEIGFKGCGSVRAPVQSATTALLFFMWLLFTLQIGRRVKCN